MSNATYSLSRLSSTQYDVLYMAVDAIIDEFDIVKLRIPRNPKHWSTNHVKKCLLWILKCFRFNNIDISMLSLFNGKDIINVGRDEIAKTVNNESFSVILLKIVEVQIFKNTCRPRCITLWQFILDILIEGDHNDIISWTKEQEWEFRINKICIFADMWGKCTGNPRMDPDKLSRSIRYYYPPRTQIMIHIEKQPGVNTTYTYRFIDVKSLLHTPIRGASYSTWNKVLIEKLSRRNWQVKSNVLHHPIVI